MHICSTGVFQEEGLGPSCERQTSRPNLAYVLLDCSVWVAFVGEKVL